MQGTIPVIGYFTGQLKFQNRFALIEFFIIPSGQLLLGIDAVRNLKLVLSGSDLGSYYVDAAASYPDMLLTTGRTVVAPTPPSQSSSTPFVRPSL